MGSAETNRPARAAVQPVTQRSIRRVLAAGYGLVILCLLAAGLLGVRNLASIRATSAQLLGEQVRIQNLLEAVLRGQRAINAVFADFAREPDTIDEAQLLSQLENSDREIERIAEEAAGEPEQALWQELYNAATQFSSEARHILGEEATQRRPLRRLMNAHQRVLSLVDQLVEVEMKRSVALKQRIEELSVRLAQQSAALLGLSFLLAVLTAAYAMRWTLRLTRQLEEQAGELSRVSWQLLEKQEAVARRFSHELHDELGQTLTALKANLVMIGSSASPQQPQIEDCLQLVDSAMGTVREVSQLLRPTILDDFGLAAGLRWLCERFQQRTRMEVDFQCRLEDRLPDEVETHLFRIAQEALTNAARHSGATRISVSLDRDGQQVRLRIADNGKGLAPDAASPRGLGMVGMRARARSAGGELKIVTAPGKGLAVEAVIPFTNRVSADARIAS
ncbi:MAG: sensor histidine kinase [Bryobacteraceae bacterium]|nr:sensor histidine kinase [Bryobacteraceae bacterium]MCX7605572.1 sensor histidine kinase [Bryobacteraceae bacterium]